MIPNRLKGLREATASVAAVTLAIILAACSSSNAPASGASSTTSASSTPAASMSSGEPSMEASSSPLGSGAGLSSKWCLNTVDEVSAAVGKPVTTATGADSPGVGGGCAYTGADQIPVYGINVVSPAPAGMFDGLKAAQGAATISGIGDGAILATPVGPLVFVKGQAVVTMTILPGATMTDMAKARTAFETLGKAAAGRL